MPRPRLELAGKRFGRLVALEPSHIRSARREFFWVCKCDCGGTKTVNGRNLRNGNVRSCGCINRKHGMHRSRVYKIWCGMRARCRESASTTHYHRYGGRGIRVCDRWLSFRNFLADMGEPPAGDHTIERINNDGNYEPGNCRWATRREQNYNRRTSVKITFNGETLCISAWARRLGITHDTLRLRLNRWGLPAALTAPKYVNMDTSKKSKRSSRDMLALAETAPEIVSVIRL